MSRGGSEEKLIGSSGNLKSRKPEAQGCQPRSIGGFPQSFGLAHLSSGRQSNRRTRHLSQLPQSLFDPLVVRVDPVSLPQTAKGQFQIYYKCGAEHPEYQPDFVAETEDCVYMLEPKAKKEMDDSIVIAKRDAAVKWCVNASDHSASYGGKPWRYVLIPHDAIKDNMTLAGLASSFTIAQDQTE